MLKYRSRPVRSCGTDHLPTQPILYPRGRRETGCCHNVGYSIQGFNGLHRSIGFHDAPFLFTAQTRKILSRAKWSAYFASTPITAATLLISVGPTRTLMVLREAGTHSHPVFSFS